MKNTLILFAALCANWLLWSGHFDNPFLLGAGFVSCLLALGLSSHMRIIDEEGAPVHLSVIRLLSYAPWLGKEIFFSSLTVAKIVLSPSMPLRRSLVWAPAMQKSPLGRVLYANSLTLTPGTVSVRLQDKEVLVHALSLSESGEQSLVDMGTRVCRLQRLSADDVGDADHENHSGDQSTPARNGS